MQLQTTICRYVGETGQPRERVLFLKSAASKTEEATSNYIIQTLRCNSLDTEELAFQPHDFTNSIPGHLGGAQRKLKDKLDKTISYIPYQGHRCNMLLNIELTHFMPLVSFNTP